MTIRRDAIEEAAWWLLGLTITGGGIGILIALWTGRAP